MKHPTKQEMLLYRAKSGLRHLRREQIEDHLKNCDGCRNRLARLDERLGTLFEENRRTCEKVRDEILSMINVDSDDTKGALIRKHLEDCDRCSLLYEAAADFPSWEKVADQELELPASSQKKIEAAVLNTLKEKTGLSASSQKKSRKAEPVKQWINEVILVFYPVRPGMVFRGEESDELKVIEHAGGDLIVETGLKKQTVELTSVFEEFTVRSRTDNEGRAVFKRLKKGDYVARITGYRLKEIKTKEKPK